MFHLSIKDKLFDPRLPISTLLLILLIAGCAPVPESCPPYRWGDLSGAAAFAEDDHFPFRFPLDEISRGAAPMSTNFVASGRASKTLIEYHAAEDYLQQPGTPVYAMADGRVSFSGPMGGYGWLVIVDHPQANLYSLYGHLSPSRWRIESGAVQKGALLGYLGDSDENGGSAKQPLRPHLHLGVRAGQRADYSGMGEWRWQAGWIKYCPPELGWLQSSAVINGQDIPEGGFPEPAAGLLPIWWIELLFTAIYLFGGICMLIFATRRNKPALLLFYGSVLLIAGWIFYGKGTKMSYAIFVMAAILLVIGIYNSIRRFNRVPPAQP